jgi:CRISPR/Cas system-associated endonuclease Cas1
VVDKNIIKKISEQEMDRKAFLKYSGIALLGLVGLKTVVSLFTQLDEKQVGTNATKDASSHGFGSGKYGA